MSRFSGASYVDIAAPATACFGLVCETPRTPDWHQAITAVEILERDSDGRSTLVKASIEALVRRVEVNLRLSYQPPRLVHMRRESGDQRQLTATWTIEELADGHTRAAFQAEFDPGRALSLLAKGPLVPRLTTLLADQPPIGLKRALEGG